MKRITNVRIENRVGKFLPVVFPNLDELTSYKDFL